LNSTKQTHSDKDLQSFSFGAFVLFFLLGAFFIYKGKNEIAYTLVGVGTIFLLIRLIRFQLVAPLYSGWMKFAEVLAKVNTRIILFLVFVLTVVPIALLLKLFRKDVLDSKLEKEKGSYWVSRPKKEINPRHYERHF
jgi:Saxitoxin biosynthesis operon protein SxtJ